MHLNGNIRTQYRKKIVLCYLKKVRDIHKLTQNITYTLPSVFDEKITASSYLIIWCGVSLAKSKISTQNAKKTTK